MQAGLDKAADDLATLGLTLENCLLDRGPDAADAFRRTVRERHYDIIIVGGGIRLEPSMTPLFEKIVNIAREVTPDSILCFNTGPPDGRCPTRSTPGSAAEVVPYFGGRVPSG